MDYAAALTNLDGRVNMETGRLNDAPPDWNATPVTPGRQLATPSLERLRTLLGYLGEPQLDVPFIHITGTNGKGSTARMATALLAALGTSVGTYLSPHLERVNERIGHGGQSISDEDFAAVMTDVVRAENAAGVRCSFFEAMTAAAYRWFGDVAVEAAVIEVGMGGRWDPTNLGDGLVAVVTNVEIDHQEYLGTTREEIATEKIGIVKDGAVAVLGEPDPDIAALLAREAERLGAAAIWQRGRDFDCEANRLALGGRVLALRTPAAVYEDVFVPLYGRHQGDNAAGALAAVEAFVGAALPDDVVERGFAAVQNPGRMEVMGRRPLVLLDGAHNPAGARAAAVTLAEEFAASDGRVLVVGLLNTRDPRAMLEALDARQARTLIAVSPPSPRALDPRLIADAAHLLGIDARVASSVEAAIEAGLEGLGENELCLVTGTLYLVGAARPILRRRLP